MIIDERCNPPKTTHQSKKIVRVGGFSKLADTEQLEAATSFWDSLFLPHRPDKPMEGALSLEIHLAFPHGKNEAKCRKDLDIPMTVRPDCSNMAKTIEDSLVRCGFMQDDSQVVRLLTTKCKSPRPGVVIVLEPAELVAWRRE